MSKKKGKTAKKAPNKKAPNKAAKRPVPASRRSTRLADSAEGYGRTSQVTIFLFRTSNGNKIRTSPQHAFAGPGYIEWTVVNLIDGSDVPVTISWPNGGPWGKDPVAIRSFERKDCNGVEPGRYKYVVSAYDTQEDPEVEFPEM